MCQTTKILLSLLGGIVILAFNGCPPTQTQPSATNPPATTGQMPAPAAGVDNLKWVTGMAAGAEAAKAAKLPMVVDVGASWCGWCKKLAEESFPDPAVQALGDQFVWVKVDADQEQDVSKKYNIAGLPTILVLDAAGKQIDRQEGFVDGPKLAEFFKQALAKVPG